VRALSTQISLTALLFVLTLSGMAAAADCDVSGDIPNNVSTATWYGGAHNGHRTSSGEIFDKRKLTAAHPSLPLLSTVEVTNLANGKKIQVRINDRGGMANASEIDLSEAAANSLGLRRCGMGMVVVSAPLPQDKIQPQPKLQTAALTISAKSKPTGKHETSRSGSLLGRTQPR
jgi:rare lipoprotein A